MSEDKDIAKLIRAHGEFWDDWISRDAADEIERLRARVETGSIISKRSYGAFAKALGRKINDAG